jgi:hypothetical protein
VSLHRGGRDLIEWCHAAGFQTADCLFHRPLIGIIGAIE